MFVHTPGMSRKVRIAAIASLFVAAFGGLAGGQEVSAVTPTFCSTGPDCYIVPVGTSTSNTSSTINLTKNVAMTPVEFETNVDVPSRRTVIKDAAGQNLWMNPAEPGLSANYAPFPNNSGPLPSGITVTVTGFSPYRLRISGTPTVATTRQLEITVSEAAGSSLIGIYTLTIQVTVDTTAPSLLSAIVPAAGRQITLDYNENLSSSAPDATSFTVLVGGQPVTVSAVSISGSQVTLTLASPVAPGVPVLISYALPGWSRLGDAAGNQAAAISSQVVTNNSTLDVVEPSLTTSAVVATGDSIELTYDEALGTSTPDAADIAVSVDGQPVAVTLVQVNGRKTVLTLGSTVHAGSSVTLNYTPATGRQIKDIAGNNAAPLAATSVVNGSTVAAPTTTVATPTTTVAATTTTAPTTTVSTTRSSSTSDSTGTVVTPSIETKVVAVSTKNLPQTGSSNLLLPALALFGLGVSSTLVGRRRFNRGAKPVN